jgi:thiol-disulfide isomerase/thioredoxin
MGKGGFVMKLKNLAVLAIVIVLAGLAVYNDRGKSEKEAALPVEAAPAVGYLAPGFELNSFEGASYKIGGQRDKPLFLNFWASWCGPCEEEAPTLAKMYEKYKDKLDLYAVNATGNDDFDAAKAFAGRYKFTFPVLLDHKLDAIQMYRVQVIPTSYLIDKNGVIVDVVNLMEPDELEKKIRKLIDG